MPTLLQYLLLGIGGGIGTMLRYFVAEICANYWGRSFPWGTILINISGCFIIGFFALITLPHGRWPVHENIRQFVTIGLLGGYTTFSAFSFQTWSLAQNDWRPALWNVTLSVTLCLSAVWLGAALASYCNKH